MFQLLIVAIVVISASGQDTDPPEPTLTPASRPQTCEGKNEIYLKEGVAPNCDTVCSEIGQPCTRVYVKAPSGCYCLPNHARDANNVCVPINECQILCKSMEISNDGTSLSLRVSGTLGTHPSGLPLPSLPLPHLRLPHLPLPHLPSQHLPLPQLPSPSSPSSSLSKPLLPSLLPHPRFPLPLPHPSSSQQSAPRSLSQPSVSSISSISSVSSISSIPSLQSTHSLPLLPSIQSHQSRFLQSRLLRPRGVCSYPSFLSSNAAFSPDH